MLRARLGGASVGTGRQPRKGRREEEGKEEERERTPLPPSLLRSCAKLKPRVRLRALDS